MLPAFPISVWAVALPDNLLKLGLSLGNLGQNDQACKAFAEIDKKFPTARADIRDRAAAERKQRNCK